MQQKKKFPNCAIKQPYSQETVIRSGSLKLITFSTTDTLILLIEAMKIKLSFALISVCIMESLC
jgi:hypothetical protein